jgi:hypothetical protein
MTARSATETGGQKPSSLLSRGALDLIGLPPHHPGMDRRRFLLTSEARKD